MRSLFFFLIPALCLAQADYLHHDFSTGYRYETRLGRNSYDTGDSSGYSLKYSYRPLRWLALDAGFEHIIHPIGSSVCCRYYDSADDHLLLVPFGLRFVWESGRARLSAGGGGAYMNHTIGHIDPGGGLNGASGFGVQAVASADYAITQSGRWRAGGTVRYYYVPVSVFTTARFLTVGPDFTFSFR